MSVEYYQSKLNEITEKKRQVNAQIKVLIEKLNSTSANDKHWMDWYNEKTELNNELCKLIGREKHYEIKIASFI